MENIRLIVKNNNSLETKNEVLKYIAKNVSKLDDKLVEEEIYEGFIKREEQSSTGFEDGFAIPHTKVRNLDKSVIYMVRDLNVPWQSMDGKNANVAIAILVGESGGDEHLKILSSLSRKLIDENIRKMFKNSHEEEVKKIILNDGLEKRDTKPKKEKYIIGVTACPTGIAHTYMAAESLEKTAEKLGYEVKIETRGQGGVGNEITKEDIKRADGVIIACDVDVPLERFNGKKMVKVPVKKAIQTPEKLLNEVQVANEFVYEGGKEDNSEEKVGAYKALMTGVTYMLPFVVVGGIFTALRFIFGTQDDIAAGVTPVIEMLNVGQFFGNMGGILFALMLPILGGYIAYSIGNRAALMPGFLVGVVASSQGSGFLGAIIGGFVAGYVAKYFFQKMSSIPKSLQGSYQILFLPIICAVIVGVFMLLFGIPIQWLNTSLTNFLLSVQGYSPILLGAIIGIMMAADMGGPINKAAYVTGTLLLADGNQTFMAAVMAGGMVPPLAIALSTMMYKDKYTQEEKEAGKTNWIMGLSFVTEGAIPFATANPKKVIPPLMLGSAVAGALTMLFNVKLPAPHGGIFVFPLIDNVGWYVVSIAIGTLVGAIFLGILKEKE